MTRILHILDHSLPLHSGYTFRTRAIMKAQQAAGLEVRGITGLRHTAPPPAAGALASETVEGLTFHRTAGTARGPVGLREWNEIALLAAAIDRLCDSWQPDILHAHLSCAAAGKSAQVNDSAQ